MARADLMCDLIKYGLQNDSVHFRKAAEALSAEERTKQHTILADKIQDLLATDKKHFINDNSSVNIIQYDRGGNSLFWEITPQKTLDSLILPEKVKSICDSIIDEQMRSELLQSYGIEPRNRILLIGPPGNGKTSLAEAVAESLMIPLLTVRYESIIGAYLGETASKLSKLFEISKTRKCVLFFDEFETLGKERGDIHETGEIKRVVSSLLMQIDSLPSYVIVMAATNHESLLDKAAWRRFQIRIEMPMPTRDALERYYSRFQEEKGIEFGVASSTLAKKSLGYSFAEAEELAMEIYRQYILNIPVDDMKNITNRVIDLWKIQKMRTEAGEKDA